MFPLNLTEFSEIFNTPQILLYLGISALNALLLFLSSMKFLLVLQQCGYRGKRFFKWLDNKETPYKSRLMLLCLLAFLFFCVLNMCFASLVGEEITSFFGFMSYLLFIFIYIKSERHVNVKVPLKITRRLVRLCITYFILLTAITFGVLLLIDYLAFLINVNVVAILRYANSVYFDLRLRN